jgi:hypothetical protein
LAVFQGHPKPPFCHQIFFWWIFDDTVISRVIIYLFIDNLYMIKFPPSPITVVIYIYIYIIDFDFDFSNGIIQWWIFSTNLGHCLIWGTKTWKSNLENQIETKISLQLVQSELHNVAHEKNLR